MRRARATLGKAFACVTVLALIRALVGCASTGDDAATTDAAAAEASVLPEAGPADAAHDSNKPPSACSTDGWCHAPLPGVDAGGLGEVDPDVPPYFDLRDVWVAPDHRAFAVSSGGHVLRWSDAQGWTIATRAKGGLTKVWGTTSSDLWVGGAAGLLLHGTGDPLVFADVSIADPQAVRALGGTSATDVWVSAGGLYHGDGKTWTAVAPLGPDPRRLPYAGIAGIWGNRPTDLWAAGYYSYYASDNDDSPTLEDLLLRWTPGEDGGAGAWQRIPVDPTGLGPFVPHFIAASTTSALLPILALSQTEDRGGDRPCTLLREALSLDAGVLGAVTTPTGLTYGRTEGIWASTASDVWMVGTPGILRHFDGATWRLSRASITPGALFSPLHAISGVVTSGKSDLWIVGENLALHRDERAVPVPGGP